MEDELSPATREKRSWPRWLSSLLALGVLALTVQWWQTRDLAGIPAPLLRGVLSDGREFDLADYRGGRPVLVHFWAEWCPVCRAEEGTIDDLAEDYPVFTVATQSGDAERINTYLRERELDFPVLVDESGNLGGRWGIRGIPSSFIIDADGRIASASTGYTTSVGLRVRLWLAEM